MKYNKEILTVLKEYTEKSSVAGLHYAFDPKLSKISNILWMIMVIALTFLGMYTSVQTYTDWKNEPVTTSVSSTGLPIAEVPFPSVVICSQGSDVETTTTAFYKLLLENLSKNLSSNITPLKFQRLINSLIASPEYKKVNII
jgi:hypothetical protein